MKFSIATAVAFASAVFAMPKITNSNFEITEGVPFEITWADQEGPVTITLKNGPHDALKTVQVIETGNTGDSFIWTPEDLPSGTYAFQIDDDSKVPNYSKQFPYEGTGPALSSASVPVSSSAVSSVTSASSTADSTITSSASESTAESSRTSTSTTSTTSRAPPANTVVNNNNSEGQRFSSPLALLLVTVAGVIFFN